MNIKKTWVPLRRSVIKSVKCISLMHSLAVKSQIASDIFVGKS